MIKREYFEIRDQVHKMYAGGSQDNEQTIENQAT